MRYLLSSKSLARLVCLWICTWSSVIGAYAAHAAPAVPARGTLAFQLLELERQGGSPPAESEAFLEKILVDAYAALGDSPRPPATAEEFRRFAETVSISLAKKNFLQPARREDEPDSIGAAFRLLPANHRGLVASKTSAQNTARLRYADPSAPFRHLDCDMGSLLIISVAQMVGFDLKLVEVPIHNFVRWHAASTGTVLNWDWTKWGSFPDSHYEMGIPRIQLTRKIYLKSQTSDETMGYYLAVLTRNISDPQRKLQLRREALRLAPTNPVTANNVAWSFATLPEGVESWERRDAVALALSAWASDPADIDFLDTTACAFAAAGEKAIALAIETRAESMASGRKAEDLRANKERIERDELCR